MKMTDLLQYCGQSYKPCTIANNDSRVVIYDRRGFIRLVTGSDVLRKSRWIGWIVSQLHFTQCVLEIFLSTAFYAANTYVWRSLYLALVRETLLFALPIFVTWFVPSVWPDWAKFHHFGKIKVSAYFLRVRQNIALIAKLMLLGNFSL